MLHSSLIGQLAVGADREGLGSTLQLSRPRAGNSKWMYGRSAHLRGALLGLVLERPGHGGDLANRLTMRFEGSWQTDAHDVYRLLEGLEAEGLVCAREERRRNKRLGSRVVYHATGQTSLALSRWIETLFPRDPLRVGLHAKLAVAREQDLPGLRLALKQYQRECLMLAQAVCPSDGQPRSWSALFMDCTRDGITRMLQTEIEWASRTLQRIDEYAAQHS